MKHLIKWMKISAFINFYLCVIMTFVLIALIVDIGLDSYWHGTEFKAKLLNEVEQIECTTNGSC